MPRAICLLTALLLTAVVGCPPEPARLNAPPQGASVRQPDIHTNFDYMQDQALISDMSITDLHFVPHTADLNGTGRARLERYAELLAGHGGTLMFDTSLSDGDLIAARLQTAESFVNEYVPDDSRIAVVTGLPGGRGMTADEAIVRRKQMLSRSAKTNTSESDIVPLDISGGVGNGGSGGGSGGGGGGGGGGG